MDEEVKEILRRYGNFMDGYDGDLDEIDFDEALKQICQLFEKCPKCGGFTFWYEPWGRRICESWKHMEGGCSWDELKPDEGRLLTDELIEEALDEYAKILKTKFNPLVHYVIGALLEAQRDLTASIIRLECQERVEMVFREIENESYLDPQTGYRWLYPSDWQALKKKEGVK